MQVCKKNGGIKTGTLTIQGDGCLTATGGIYAAGIGGECYHGSSNIIINGGTIIAVSPDSGAGIGGGDYGNGQNIEILDGKITAISKRGFGAGIGGGDYASGIDIYIMGGEINAISSCDHSNESHVGHGAAIGGGLIGIGRIYISGGKIIAEAAYSGAAIGGGSGSGGLKFSRSTIEISGGSIVAVSSSPCCEPTISDTGIYAGAGIGGGDYGYAKIIIEGKDTVVIAKGADGAYDIGSGADGADSAVNLNDGLISEPYTGNGITDGTIVHYTGTNPDPPDPNKPDPPNPDKPDPPTPDKPTPSDPVIPDDPNNPDDPEKLQVSLSDPYNNASANLTYTDSLILQAGARTKDSVKFTFAYTAHGIGDLTADLDCTAKGLGMDTLTLSAQESANLAIDRLDHALCKVSMIRSTFGAAQNRLEYKIDNLCNTAENLTAAESRIRDTDMAREMTEFTKNQIITQSSQAMLAQANMLPQQAMSLINS